MSNKNNPNRDKIAIARKQIKTIESVIQKFQKMTADWEDVDKYFESHFENYANIFADTKQKLTDNINDWKVGGEG